MQNKIHLRRAIESDATQIAKVHIASWQAIYRDRIPESVLNNLSLSKWSASVLMDTKFDKLAVIKRGVP